MRGPDESRLQQLNLRLPVGRANGDVVPGLGEFHPRPRQKLQPGGGSAMPSVLASRAGEAGTERRWQATRVSCCSPSATNFIVDVKKAF